MPRTSVHSSLRAPQAYPSHLVTCDKGKATGKANLESANELFAMSKHFIQRAHWGVLATSKKKNQIKHLANRTARSVDSALGLISAKSDFDFALINVIRRPH